MGLQNRLHISSSDSVKEFHKLISLWLRIPEIKPISEFQFFGTINQLAFDLLSTPLKLRIILRKNFHRMKNYLANTFSIRTNQRAFF